MRSSRLRISVFSEPIFPPLVARHLGPPGRYYSRPVGPLIPDLRVATTCLDRGKLAAVIQTPLSSSHHFSHFFRTIRATWNTGDLDPTRGHQGMQKTDP